MLSQSAPAAQRANVFGDQGLVLNEFGLQLFLQRVVEGVAHHDLARTRVGHQTCAHIQRVADETDMRSRKRPEWQQAKLSKGDADVETMLVLNAINPTFPMLRGRGA